MKSRKRNIITNNREIYEKFNMLHFSNEVLLKGVKKRQIDMILKRLNKNKKILVSEVINPNYILLKKKGRLNFNMYFK